MEGDENKYWIENKTEKNKNRNGFMLKSKCAYEQYKNKIT